MAHYKDPEAVRRGSMGGRPHGRRTACFKHFGFADLAEAIGVSTQTLRLYFKDNPVKLSRLSLRELNELINSLKDKRPLNTNCPRAKHRDSPVEKPDRSECF